MVHPTRRLAEDLAKITESWWTERGATVFVEASANGPDPALFRPDVDLAISLGGDGTILRTVALAAPNAIPVLGVNLGNLGYLTTVEPDEITEAFSILASGSFEVEERMLLDVAITTGATEDEGATRHVVAMNEVVVEKTSDGHTIHLGVTIGGEAFLTYAADGILVATPTGSTAYNLSLRGPIVSPRMSALVMTPIAPHMMFDRTLVIEPDLDVELELLADREAVAVIDGERLAELAPGDSVRVRASTHRARMIKIGDRGFYKILQTKFGLSDR